MPSPRAAADRGRALLDAGCAGLRYVLVAVAALWILTVGLTEIAGAPAVALGKRLLQDASFSKDELLSTRASIRTAENSSAAWANAIISLRLFEIESAATEPVAAMIEEQRGSAEVAVRRALLLSPNDGYLWYALFALNLPASGPPAERTMPFLAKSYELAPWEGWVSIRRAPTLIPLRASLPAPFKSRLEDEFRALLRQNILPPVQKIFALSGPDLRQEVLEHIQTLPQVERIRFMRGLARELDDPGN